MRILLISANTEPFPEAVFPLGAVYVAASWQKAGAKVRVFDMRLHPSQASLKNELKAFGPDLIGISLRNIDNAAFPATRWYLPSYASLIASIRSCCNARIILGGSAFSLFPDEILAYLGADGGITGEGEGTEAMLCHPRPERITASVPADLAEVGLPGNISEIFPGFRTYRTIGIQTARGCPNACIYCTYPHLEGRKRRNRPPELVSTEIAKLYRDFGIRDFFIVDSLFNADEGHMLEVARGISALNLPVRFSCYIQPKVSDPEMFRILKKSGCIAVDFGTDSGSATMLESLGKSFVEDDIRKASLACRKEGLDFCHSLILGGPGETRETIRETVGLMDEVSPRAVIAMTGIRIYPFTEIERIAVREGLHEAGKSLLEPRFYFSAMGSSALLKCAYEAGEKRRNWFFPGKRDWGSAPGFKLLRFLHREGPLWRIFKR